MKYIYFLILLLLSFTSIAEGPDDIQYVTGKLYLSLYQQADSGSQVIKSLVSGDRLDVIEIAGPYAKVITDSGKEGWVKKGFLVKEKPARILFKEANDAYENLLKDMKNLKEKNQNIESIEEELASIKTENTQLINKNKLLASQLNIDEVQQKSLVKELNDTDSRIDLDIFMQFIKEYVFFLIACLIVFVLIGYRMGEIKKEAEVIKHFGGVRVW